MKGEKNDALDLMKFILALFVVALHVQPIRVGYEGLRLICRLAVPLFFITSGFFYFKKIKNIRIDEQNKCLLKFLIRGLKLYISWMILLLPFTIVFRQWYKMSILQALLSFIIHFFFGSTFIASWYLMALLIGISIITVVSKKLPNKVLFGLSLATYLLCCAWSGYGKLTGLPVISRWPQIYNSFPVSFIWLVIGKLIAEEKIKLPSGKKKNYILIAAIALYVTEYYNCIHNNWANNTDSLVTMVPICLILFLNIENLKFYLGNKSNIFRQISTVSYCFHASVGVVLKVVLRVLFHANMEIEMWMIVRYLLTIMICVIATIMIQKLERQVKIVGWLY